MVLQFPRQFLQGTPHDGRAQFQPLGHRPRELLHLVVVVQVDAVPDDLVGFQFLYAQCDAQGLQFGGLHPAEDMDFQVLRVVPVIVGVGGVQIVHKFSPKRFHLQT